MKRLLHSVMILAASMAIPATMAAQPVSEKVDTVAVQEVDDVDLSVSGTSLLFDSDDLPFDDLDTAGSALATGMLAIIGVFFIPPLIIIGIIWVTLSYRNSNRRRRYELISQALSRGINLPAELLIEPPKSGLRAGVTLICTGVGIFILFLCLDQWRIGLGIGAIPALVGIGKLITLRLEK